MKTNSLKKAALITGVLWLLALGGCDNSLSNGGKQTPMAAPDRQTPTAGDYTFGNLSQTEGSVGAVTITAKPNKSGGTITVYYNGDATIPQTAGLYAVSFNVAPAEGWNGETGLSAGMLSVGDTLGGEFSSGSGTIADPYVIKYTGDLTLKWGDINTLNRTAGKYVILDLSSASFLNNRITGGQVYPSPNDMNIIKDNQYIKGIILPDSLQEIYPDAFRDCSFLTSITIPSGVTRIGMSTFYKCSSLTSITIPSGVISIDANAFSYCSSLNSITIPSGVTSIGMSAFNECSSLSSITIPSGVTSIEMFTFAWCSSLTSITIPSGVTNIGLYAFARCRSLTSVTFSGGNNISEGNFGNDAFPEVYGPEQFNSISGNNLKIAYLAASPKAGTYTRDADGSTWTKVN